MSILGMYKQSSFTDDLKVGTPDPKGYHDVSAVPEAARRLPGNHDFGGLRGVIIPRATRDGASMGFDHMAPQKAFIDPDFTGGRIVVDMAKIQENPGLMVQAIQHHYSQCNEPADAAIAAFAEFRENIEETAPTMEIQRDLVPTPAQTPPPERHPRGLSGNYVAPRASSGGAQVRPASFTMPQQKQAAAPPAETMTFTDGSRAEVRQPVAKPEPVGRAASQARSLRSELMGSSSSSFNGDNTSLKKVTFEVPIPGQPNANLGRFDVFYHDVVREGDVLVLIYDHSHPTQMVWFPPVVEDPQTKETMAMPVLVHGGPTEPSMLYLAYPTGVQFMRQSEQFCILTVEKEKPIAI